MLTLALLMLTFVFLDRKIVYDYEKYGDTPICLNDQFDISDKETIIEGFGIDETGEEVTENQIAQLITMSNEECTKWIKNNASAFDIDGEIAELPEGINRYILCTRGVPFIKNDILFGYTVSLGIYVINFAIPTLELYFLIKQCLL